MLNVKHVATVALSSALTAWDSGYPPLPDTIHEMRLAHSLLTEGDPTPEELRPILGERWEIRSRRDHRREMTGRNSVSATDYAAAQIRALAVRLNLTEGFVAARLQPVSRHHCFATNANRMPRSDVGGA
jgi:hypothetical protein